MPGLRMIDSDHYYRTTDMKQKELTGEQSLLSTMNKFVHAVNEMDDTVMIPSKLMDMPYTKPPQKPAEKSVVAITNSNGKPGDLYSFYTMLNAIKSELVRGPKSEEDLEEEPEKSESERTEADELARQSAEMFRHHLKGLFSVLKQLTNTANHVTSDYQQVIGEYSSRPASSSFTM